MGKLDDQYPGLPIKLGPVSNGEYLPPPTTPLIRETVKRAREQAFRNADRLGMSRRQFLLSTMGAATTLAMLSACSKEANKASGGGPSSTGVGGTYNVPADAQLDYDAAYEALGGEEFIFDVQTHFLDANHDIPSLGIDRMFAQRACGEDDPRDCFSVDWYLDLLFNKSDTNMIVISALPFAGSPLNPEVMSKTIELADRIGCTGRVLMQGEAHPSYGTLEQALDNMADIHSKMPVGAWKTYTHWGGPGWWLDDHDPAAPKVGEAFLQKVEELGPPLVAVHKGFGSGSPFADPVDVGPAAKKHPNLTFVVYHSGFDVEGGRTEGPYEEKDNWGINRLITSVRRAGVGGPGGNVYAELGSTWKVLMGNPTAAAHALGKLLNQFGEDNIVWGTDSIWYGSPQDQIEAFRAFEITPEFQEKFGYPALTKKIKAKILGLNSARLYGVKPITGICRFDREKIENTRLTSFDGNLTFGPRTPDEIYRVRQAELMQFTSFS